MLDSTIKLYQLNIPELSGYILEFIQPITGETGQGSFTLTGSGLVNVFSQGNTIYIGASSYNLANSGDLTNLYNSLSIQNSLLYYPVTNPSGFITSGALSGFSGGTGNINTGAFVTTGQTGIFLASGNPYIDWTDSVFFGGWTIDNLYVNSNLGINNGNPIYNLDINGIIGNSISDIQIASNQNVYITFQNDSALIVNNASSNNLLFLEDNGGKGFLGINGNTNPIYNIDVNGSIGNSLGNLTINSAGDTTLNAGNNLNLNVTALFNASFNNESTITIGANKYFKIQDSSSNPLFYISSIQNGLMGIKTITPKFQLDVNGTGNFSKGLNVSGIINFSGNSFTYNGQQVLTGITGTTFVTTGQTGNFITVNQTGQFYSNSNPSGFITGLNTGSFITKSQTGSFVDISSVQIISGAKTFSSPFNISTSGGHFQLNNIDFVLSDSNNTSSINILNRNTIDSNGISSIDWSNRYLIDYAGSNSIDWNNKILFGNWTNDTTFSVGTDGAYFDSSGNWFLNNSLHGTLEGDIVQNGTNVYLDIYGNFSADSLSVSSVPNAGSLYVGITLGDSNPANGEWNVSSNSTGTMNFYRIGTTGQLINKFFFDQSGNAFFPSLHTTSGLTVSGFNVILTNQTGAFYSSANPLGFVTGVNTSGFITTGQTGAFYPFNSNPLNYLTGFQNITGIGFGAIPQHPLDIINTGQNPGGIISLMRCTQDNDTALEIQSSGTVWQFSVRNTTDNNPKGFNFYYSPDSGNTYFNNLNISSGGNVTITGTCFNNGVNISGKNISSYYYPIGNPSGFITGLNTGNFITTSQTGQIIANTVLLTGNQTISGTKTFGNSLLTHFISGVSNSGSINFDSQLIIDTNNKTSLNWQGRLGVASNNTTSFDWGNRILYYPEGSMFPSLDWGNGYLYDLPNNALSLDWGNRLLYDSTSIVSIDYNQRILSGNWTVAGPGIPFQITSPKINFKVTGNYLLYGVPTGYIYLMDKMEIITTNISSANQAPYICFGNTTSSIIYTNAIQTVSNSQYARHIFDNPQDGISAGTILTASILTGSTATIHSGYFIYKGHLINS